MRPVAIVEVWFLLRGESNFAIDVDSADNSSETVRRGPYNHVTSQSFSLVHFSKVINTLEILIVKAYQCKVSGGTVFNRYFDFVQARHVAFSSLILLS